MKQGLIHAGERVHTDIFHIVAYKDGVQIMPQIVIANPSQAWDYVQAWFDFQNATAELEGIMGCESKYRVTKREGGEVGILYIRNASDAEVAEFTNDVFVGLILSISDSE